MQNKIKIVFNILLDEVGGNVKNALEKMDKNYSMTWMYNSKKKLFPVVEKQDIKKVINDVYAIKGRKYEVYNFSENESSVFVELIESYPVKNKVYRTPLVLVIYFENGKISLGRHYCDPTIYKVSLDKKIINKAYKNQKPKFIISSKGIEKTDFK